MGKKRLQRGDRYYTDASGLQVPRCTVVLSEMGNNDSLTYWKLNEVIAFLRRRPKATDKQVFEALGQRAEQGAARGHAVHKVAEKWRPGRPIRIQRYSPEIQGHIKGLLLFIRDHNPKFIHAEKMVASRKYKYGATIDKIMTLQRGTQWYVVDIKTSPKIVMSFRAQVAANLEAAIENKLVPKHARGAILQTFPDGTYNFRPVLDPFWIFRNYLELWWYDEVQKPSLRDLPKDWPASRRGVRKFPKLPETNGTAPRNPSTKKETQKATR